MALGFGVEYISNNQNNQGKNILDDQSKKNILDDQSKNWKSRIQ